MITDDSIDIVCIRVRRVFVFPFVPEGIATGFPVIGQISSQSQ